MSFCCCTCCLLRLWEQSSNCSSLVSTALPSFWRTWEETQYTVSPQDIQGVHSQVKRASISLEHHLHRSRGALLQMWPGCDPTFPISRRRCVSFHNQHQVSDVATVWEVAEVWQNDRRCGIKNLELVGTSATEPEEKQSQVHDSTWRWQSNVLNS